MSLKSKLSRKRQNVLALNESDADFQETLPVPIKISKSKKVKKTPAVSSTPSLVTSNVIENCENSSVNTPCISNNLSEISETSLLPCPLCGFIFQKSDDSACKNRHMKNCSNQKGINHEKLIQIRRLQEKQAKERAELGIPSPPLAPINVTNTSKRKNNTTSKSSKSKIKSSSDPHLELAIALSASLARSERDKIVEEQESLKALDVEINDIPNSIDITESLPDHMVTSYENKPKIRQRIEKKKAKTSLEVRTESERSRIITERVSIISCATFTDSIPLNNTNFSTNSYINGAKTNKFWNMSSASDGNYNSGIIDNLKASHIKNISSKNDEIPKLNESPLKNNSFKDANINSNSNSSTSKICQDYDNLFISGDMADLKVYSKENSLIKCHSIIILARCKKILDDIIIEKGGNEVNKLISWNFATKKAIIAFLRFIYSGKITEVVKMTTYEGLKILSSRYEQTELDAYLNSIDQTILVPEEEEDEWDNLFQKENGSKLSNDSIQDNEKDLNLSKNDSIYENQDDLVASNNNSMNEDQVDLDVSNKDFMNEVQVVDHNLPYDVSMNESHGGLEKLNHDSINENQVDLKCDSPIEISFEVSTNENKIKTNSTSETIEKNYIDLSNASDDEIINSTKSPAVINLDNSLEIIEEKSKINIPLENSTSVTIKAKKANHDISSSSTDEFDETLMLNKSNKDLSNDSSISKKSNTDHSIDKRDDHSDVWDNFDFDQGISPSQFDNFYTSSPKSTCLIKDNYDCDDNDCLILEGTTKLNKTDTPNKNTKPNELFPIVEENEADNQSLQLSDNKEKANSEMPDFDIMSSSQINSELDKFGVKHFRRDKAILLLEHIYTEKAKLEKKNKVNEVEENSDVSRNSSTDESSQEGDDVELIIEDDPNPSSEFNKAIQLDGESLKQSIIEFFTKDKDLNRKALLYEDISLQDTFLAFKKKQGVLCKLPEFKDILDSMSINTRSETGTKNRTKKKNSKKL